MRRVEPNEYEVNPHYFAKGEWRSISQRRQDYELTITTRPMGAGKSALAVSTQRELATNKAPAGAFGCIIAIPYLRVLSSS